MDAVSGGSSARQAAAGLVRSSSRDQPSQAADCVGGRGRLLQRRPTGSLHPLLDLGSLGQLGDDGERPAIGVGPELAHSSQQARRSIDHHQPGQRGQPDMPSSQLQLVLVALPLPEADVEQEPLALLGAAPGPPVHPRWLRSGGSAVDPVQEEAGFPQQAFDGPVGEPVQGGTITSTFRGRVRMIMRVSVIS
jgi:hypothetical protein